jgi:hypothetical protein
MDNPKVTLEQLRFASGNSPFLRSDAVVQSWVNAINASPWTIDFRRLLNSGKIFGFLFDPDKKAGTGITTSYIDGTSTIVLSGGPTQTPTQIAMVLSQEGFHAATVPAILKIVDNRYPASSYSSDFRARLYAKLLLDNEARSELQSTNYLLSEIRANKLSKAEALDLLLKIDGAVDPMTGLTVRQKLLLDGEGFSGGRGFVPAELESAFIDRARIALAGTKYMTEIAQRARSLTDSTLDNNALKGAATSKLDGFSGESYLDVDGRVAIRTAAADGSSTTVALDGELNVLRIEQTFFDSVTGQFKGRATTNSGVELSTSTFSVSDDGSKLENITYTNGTMAIRVYAADSSVPYAMLVPVQIGGDSLYDTLYFDGSRRTPLVENGQVTGSSISRQDGVVKLSEQYSIGGTLLSKTSFTPLDDGSSITTVAYPNGTVDTTTRNADNSVFQRSQIVQSLGGRSSDTTVASGSGQTISQTHVDYYFDDFGNRSRVETVSNFSNGVVTTVRNTYDNDSQLFNSETLRVFNFYDQQTTTTLNDILGVVQSIQSGQSGLIANSSLRLVNTVFNPLDPITQAFKYPSLNAASTLGNGLVSLYNLGNALEHGDALTKVNATLQTVSYVNNSLPILLNGGKAAVAYSAELNNVLSGTAGANGGLGLINGGTPGALPVLGLVLAIRSGDPVGIIQGAIGVVNPALLTSPIGWILTGIQILRVLLAETPTAWGTAKVVFDTNGQLKLDTVGEGVGIGNANKGMIDLLNDLSAKINAQQSQKNGELAIVPQRLPNLSWREARLTDSGYSITDIDPITGEQKYPYLRFDDQGLPFSSNPAKWQPDPADPVIRGSMTNYLTNIALARGAIGAKWEADTAKIQAQFSDPNAGLSEQERFAKLGQGALYDPITKKPVGEFHPITLDLDGDGLISKIAKDDPTNSVGFNWDDTGFRKQTDWVRPNGKGSVSTALTVSI